MNVFRPIAGSTIQIAATSTSGRVAIPTAALKSNAMRVTYTVGTAAARLRSGDSTVVAVTLTDMIFPNPGTPFVYSECVGISSSDTHIAAITDTGTCTAEITFGFGE